VSVNPSVRLSVALVTRNRPESLDRCLASVRAQGVKPWEVRLTTRRATLLGFPRRLQGAGGVGTWRVPGEGSTPTGTMLRWRVEVRMFVPWTMITNFQWTTLPGA
jgi:hypothetical protein